MSSSVLMTPGRSDPATSAAAVSPNDSTDLSAPTRALWVGGAGDGTLKVDMLDGQAVSFAGVTVGWYPLRVTRVYDTGTGVTSIVAVW